MPAHAGVVDDNRIKPGWHTGATAADAETLMGQLPLVTLMLLLVPLPPEPCEAAGCTHTVKVGSTVLPRAPHVAMSAICVAMALRVVFCPVWKATDEDRLDWVCARAVLMPREMVICCARDDCV